MGLSTSNLTTINPYISVQIPSKPNSPGRILGHRKSPENSAFPGFFSIIKL